MKQRLTELLSNATREDPITRADLVAYTGFADRQVRKAIDDLRDEGLRIVSTSKGYYIAATEEDYKAFRALYIARVRTMLARLKKMDAFTEGQLELELCEVEKAT